MPSAAFCCLLAASDDDDDHHHLSSRSRFSNGVFCLADSPQYSVIQTVIAEDL